MAGYRGHLFGGAVFFAGYFALLALVVSVDGAYARYSTLEQLGYPVALLGLTLLFALWPDVDIHSMGQKVFYSIFFCVDLFLVVTRQYEEAAYFGLLAILPVLSKHRGWTHSWWAMVVLPLPLLVLPYVLIPERPLTGLPFYGAALAGYMSHLFMDGLLWKRRRARKRDR